MNYDEKYMRRAMQLAATSPFDTHSNPMVGAVIVCDDRIIGEGYHRRCGEGHAEVNAVASVTDKSLLKRSTMYVTLEPCSHYGKTPPCAKLIIDSGIPRVVVGAVDPFEKVSGRGIAMLREAGVEVESGVLADDCRRLNAKFFTAHSLRRPYITLKWAQSADGYMDNRRKAGEPAYRFSNVATTMLTHRERAAHDAILTTAATYTADDPSLTVREWSGPNPKRYVYDRSGRLDSVKDGFTLISGDFTPAQLMEQLYSKGVTSVLIEAGPRFMQVMLDADLWDAIRVEIASAILGVEGTHASPAVPPHAKLTQTVAAGANKLELYSR